MSSSARGIKRLTDRELCLSAESLTADLIVSCHKLLLRQNFSSPLPLYGRWWIIEFQDRFIQTLNSWLELCSRSVWISGSWPTGTHVKAGGLISHAAASIRRWSHFNHQPANEKSKVMYVFFPFGLWFLAVLNLSEAPFGWDLFLEGRPDDFNITWSVIFASPSII